MSKQFSLSVAQKCAIREKVNKYREKKDLSWQQMADEFGMPLGRLYRMLYYGIGLSQAPLILRLLDVDWGITRKDLDYE